jgi:hypothetical protein
LGVDLSTGLTTYTTADEEGSGIVKTGAFLDSLKPNPLGPRNAHEMAKEGE